MFIKNFAYILLVLLLAGCASGSALVTGETRDPIDPSLVTIYRTAPTGKFEHIGIVKSEAVEMLSEQEAVDRAVNELKKQAAKIGANGVILLGVGERQDSYAGYTPYSGGAGYFYSGTDEYQTLQGDAIFVK
jgi:hypothetical protein